MKRGGIAPERIQQGPPPAAESAARGGGEGETSQTIAPTAIVGGGRLFNIPGPAPLSRTLRASRPGRRRRGGGGARTRGWGGRRGFPGGRGLSWGSSPRGPAAGG